MRKIVRERERVKKIDSERQRERERELIIKITGNAVMHKLLIK